MLTEELRDSRRLITENASFCAYVPFSAQYPYKVHLVARRCVPDITMLTPSEQEDLARAPKRVLMGFDALWQRSLPYILAIHQAPTDGRDHVGLAHFHIEFYPPNRTAEELKFLAGSEIGAGAFMVDMLPEASTASLREALSRAETRA